MNPTVYKLHQKPRTPKEAGLPKISISSADVTHSGFKGDFNNFRFKKKDNDPNMAIMILCMDIIDGLYIDTIYGLYKYIYIYVSIYLYIYV